MLEAGVRIGYCDQVVVTWRVAMGRCSRQRRRRMTATWDPSQYLRYSDARSRPFFDLVGQVRAEAPRVVVDAGCGPGNLTATLAERWPTAQVLGFDSSAQMIERAAEHESDRVHFAVDDVTTWAPEQPVDVLVSNATLHWIDGHDALAVRWLGVPRSRWLARVPGAGQLREPEPCPDQRAARRAALARGARS